MSISKIEARVKSIISNLLGAARLDAAKVATLTEVIMADIRRVVTRTAIIAFGFGFMVGSIAVFSSVHFQ